MGRIEKISSSEPESETNFFKFLSARKGKIEGVCITGGEPTLQPGLIDFIKKIKTYGFFVKLDTNGTKPDVLKYLLDLKLLDFVAMDIKNSPEKYSETVGVKVDIEKIKTSVELIKNSFIDYEFRTTVVPGIHDYSDFLAIANWLSGSRAYYLQEFRDVVILDDNLRKKIKNKKINLEKIKQAIEHNFQKMGIRS